MVAELARALQELEKELRDATVMDRRLVFARRDGSINPIVGFAQGLMKVTRDAAGIDRVLTLEGAPISRLSDFRTRITQGLSEARKK